MIKRVVAVAALVLASFSSHASVVYDNNAAIGGGISNNAVNWVQADNFLLAAATSITGGSIWIESQSGAFKWDGVLNYWFFASTSSKPGAVLQSGSATIIQKTDTGVLAQGGVDNIQKIDFDLSTAFSALANTSYFFGARLGSTSTGWSGAGGGNGMESLNGAFNNWFNNGRERAFLLEDGSSVPEPSSIALVGLALAGLGLSRKARQA